ncbi:MAG: hypothetical protein U1E29_02145 [Coriobacteriia bacterium]|nr:hypothetical protein [Coriobacteriia bacterium]
MKDKPQTLGQALAAEIDRKSGANRVHVDLTSAHHPGWSAARDYFTRKEAEHAPILAALGGTPTPKPAPAPKQPPADPLGASIAATLAGQRVQPQASQPPVKQPPAFADVVADALRTRPKQGDSDA